MNLFAIIAASAFVCSAQTAVAEPFYATLRADGSLNEAYRVQSYDTVAIAEGYHPLVGAPGYQMYYLWTMAGSQGRGLISSKDPAHAWVK